MALQERGANRMVGFRQYLAAGAQGVGGLMAHPATQRAIGAIVKNALSKAASVGRSSKKAKTDKKSTATFRESNGSGQKRKLKSSKGKGRKRSKVSIKKRVAKLERKTKENMAHHKFKIDEKFQVSCLTNTCAYNSTQFMSGAQFLTVLGAIPYTLESNPSVENSFNMGVVAQPLNIKIDAFATATLRNNYLYPACLKIYILKPKVDNGDAPKDDIQNGLTELANPSINNWASHLFYPSDSKRFLQKWKVLQTQDIRLQSGDEATINYKEKFVFDHKEYSELSAAYTRKYSRVFLVRICGVVAHESATESNIGTAPAKVDCVINYVYKIDRKHDTPQTSVYQPSLGLNDLTTAVVGVASAERETSAS